MAFVPMFADLVSGVQHLMTMINTPEGIIAVALVFLAVGLVLFLSGKSGEMKFGPRQWTDKMRQGYYFPFFMVFGFGLVGLLFLGEHTWLRLSAVIVMILDGLTTHLFWRLRFNSYPYMTHSQKERFVGIYKAIRYLNIAVLSAFVALQDRKSVV